MANNGIIYNVVKKLNGIFDMQQSHCNVSCNSMKCWKWDVTQLTSLQPRGDLKYAVLILNRPITQNQEYIRNFWNNATVRITIDGGTVQWDRYANKLTQDVQKSLKLPTLITGDFDSITKEVLDKYKNKGCKAVHTPDQAYTDFTKALMVLNSYCEENEIKVNHVIAIGQSSGRLDHILGNIQTLFLNNERRLLHPNTNVYILSDDTISWLLYPGEHMIIVPEETRRHKRSWCSLVPVGETCASVTSSGLKWDLDNQPLKFGELVSTSNTFSGSERVSVKCSHTLLWTMKIPNVATIKFYIQKFCRYNLAALKFVRVAAQFIFL